MDEFVTPVASAGIKAGFQLSLAKEGSCGGRRRGALYDVAGFPWRAPGSWRWVQDDEIRRMLTVGDPPGFKPRNLVAPGRAAASDDYAWCSNLFMLLRLSI